MKKTIILTISILFMGCSVFNSLLVEHNIDKKLVGTWSGSEKDEQIKGVQIFWVQYRYADGTYKIVFTVKYDGVPENQSDKFTEFGNWWVKDGVFNEMEKTSKNIDSYFYEITDSDHVIFKANKLETQFDNKNYSFVDSRVQNDSIK